MTAEIAIMNKAGVALAADSAATLNNGSKVHHWADKLFPLEGGQPVGVMIYGRAEFMDVPWEVLFRTWACTLGERRFDALHEYADDFLHFLETNPLFSEERQAEYVRKDIYQFMSFLRASIQSGRDEDSDEGSAAPRETSAEWVATLLEAQRVHWSPTERLPHLPRRYEGMIRKRYTQVFAETFDALLGDLVQDAEQRAEILDLCPLLYSRDAFAANAPVVVFAGFGEREVFPHLVSRQLEAVVAGRLKYAERAAWHVDFDEPVHIFPFAQANTMYALVEGVDPDYQDRVEAGLAELTAAYRERVLERLGADEDGRDDTLRCELDALAKQLCRELSEKMERFRYERFVEPLVSGIAELSRGDLALAAETLVNVTSFRQRVSLEPESVGGPIDVAVISKAHGFQWVKRKDPYPRRGSAPAGSRRWLC